MTRAGFVHHSFQLLRGGVVNPLLAALAADGGPHAPHYDHAAAEIGAERRRSTGLGPAAERALFAGVIHGFRFVR